MTPDLNFTRLRYFIEVARCGSFSVAAKKLYTAQPNLSKQISLMEQEIGVQLFIRTRRSVQLTAAGEYLLNQVRDIPDRLDEIFDQARIIARHSEGTLTIGILEGQGISSILAGRLKRLSTLYPQFHIELERNSFSNLRSGLTRGKYDLIFTMAFDVDDNPDFFSHHFIRSDGAIAIHNTNPLSKKSSLTLRDLKDEAFVVISPEESSAGYNQFIEHCKAAGFTPNITYKALSLETLLLCVEMNMGAALLDTHIRLDDSSSVSVIPLENDYTDICAACLESEMTPVVREFISILTKEDSTDIEA